MEIDQKKYIQYLEYIIETQEKLIKFYEKKLIILNPETSDENEVVGILTFSKEAIESLKEDIE